MYTRHPKTALAERRAELQQLFTKNSFTSFGKAGNHANMLLARFDIHEALIVTFKRDIVKNVIADLLFDVDGESADCNRSQALSVLKMQEGALPQDIIEVYSIRIESVFCFKMIFGFIS